MNRGFIRQKKRKKVQGWQNLGHSLPFGGSMPLEGALAVRLLLLEKIVDAWKKLSWTGRAFPAIAYSVWFTLFAAESSIFAFISSTLDRYNGNLHWLWFIMTEVYLLFSKKEGGAIELTTNRIGVYEPTRACLTWLSKKQWTCVKCTSTHKKREARTLETVGWLTYLMTKSCDRGLLIHTWLIGSG